ncbi:hypothetical protein KCP75_04605 [Salmonella enterica subsp. enterica]|nr:hypothetical protein KCP75_04605 [Salmonella enterica subsp. enterica]
MLHPARQYAACSLIAWLQRFADGDSYTARRPCSFRLRKSTPRSTFSGISQRGIPCYAPGNMPRLLAQPESHEAAWVCGIAMDDRT